MQQVIASKQETKALEPHKVRKLVSRSELAVGRTGGNEVGPEELWNSAHMPGMAMQRELRLALLSFEALPMPQHC